VDDGLILNKHRESYANLTRLTGSSGSTPSDPRWMVQIRSPNGRRGMPRRPPDPNPIVWIRSLKRGYIRYDQGRLLAILRPRHNRVKGYPINRSRPFNDDRTAHVHLLPFLPPRNGDVDRRAARQTPRRPKFYGKRLYRLRETE
jgi:hypothetical protein